MPNRKVLITSRSLSILVFITACQTQPASADGTSQMQIGTPAKKSALNSEKSPNYTLESIFQRVKELVEKYYPKASITIDSDKMHFEKKCQDKYDFLGDLVHEPQSGGILCDITLKSGEYTGKDKDRLPSEVNDGFHTNWTIAPYSKLQNAHLLARLSFPPDVNTGFKEKFESLINLFNKQELANEATAKELNKQEETKEKTSPAP